MSTKRWQADALAKLQAAFPEMAWELEDGVLGGRLDTGAMVHHVSMNRYEMDDGWYRAEISTGGDDDVEGMDPRDPVRAMRVALQRAGGGVRALPLHVADTEGAC